MFRPPDGQAAGGLAIVRWVTLGALFVIPFLPLVVDGRLYFPFVTGKGFAFRMLVEIALAGAILLALADRRYRPRFSFTALLFGLFVAWMALADAFAVNPHKAFWGNFERMEGWVTLAHLFAFFIVAGTVLAAENLWKAWWRTFVGASGLVCLHGLAQMAHLAKVNGIPTRIDANIGNAEFLAGYLLFAIGVTLWLAFESGRGGWRRHGLFGLAVLQTVIVLASGTRGAADALVVAAGLGSFLWLLETGRQGRRVAALSLAVPAILVATLFLARHAPLVAGNAILARFAHIGVGDLRVRFSLWRMAYEGFLARPMLGWGQEGFPYVFDRFYDPALASGQPWFDRAHNIYLDELVAGGAPALLLFLAMLAGAAHRLYRGPYSQAGRIALLAGLVAYGIQGLVVFDNLLSYIPLCALFGLAHTARSTPIGAFTRLPQVTTRPLQMIAAPVLIVSLAAVIWSVNVPTLRSGHDLMRVLHPAKGEPMRPGYLKQAIDRRGFASQEIIDKTGRIGLLVVNASDSPDEARGAFVQYALDQMRLELDRAPHEARLRLQFARLLRGVGDLDGAAREIARALDEAPRHPLLLEERDIQNRRRIGAVQPQAF